MYIGRVGTTVECFKFFIKRLFFLLEQRSVE